MRLHRTILKRRAGARLAGLAWVGLLLVVIGAGLTGPAPAAAQAAGRLATATAQPTVTPESWPVAVPISDTQAIETTGLITFRELGYVESILRGPYDTLDLRFNVPPHWRLVPVAQVQLHLLVSFNTDLTSAAGGAIGSGGTLVVSFNGVTLGTYILDHVGEYTLDMQVPLEALWSIRQDGAHELSLELDSGLSCDLSQNMTVVVRTTSNFLLPHKPVAPALNLTRLPQPIYQSTFWPESALLVIPDQPSAAELQAALTVAAAFGNLTRAGLYLAPLTYSQLTPELRGLTHLILVGRPAALPLLAELNMPAPLSGTVLAAAGALPDDGIVEMALSPWNATKVALVVSGNTEAGLIKAAQALSTGALQVGSFSNLALVSTVQPKALPLQSPETFTLAELGYAAQTLKRVGTSTAIYEFFVPAGQLVSSEAYFQIEFTHSALVNYEQSVVVINLNGRSVGSFRLSDVTAQQYNQVQINLPPAAIVPGRNFLAVAVSMYPRDVCLRSNMTPVWFTIWAESALHLPLGGWSIARGYQLDLSEYPAPFGLQPALEQVAFGLAHADPAGWQTALDIAYDLGDQAAGKVALLKAYYADEVPPGAWAGNHWLVVGRPSQLALPAELAEVLPAPFEPGRDIVAKQNMLVTYRIPPEVSVGYLELLPSPWNDSYAILAVLGNSAAGVRQAGAALTTAPGRGQLAGDFAVVYKDGLATTDTRLGTSLPGSVATLLPVTALPPEAINLSGEAARPSWILPLVGVSSGLIALTLIIMGVHSWRQHRARRRK